MINIKFETATVFISEYGRDILWLHMEETESTHIRGQYAVCFGNGVTFKTDISSGDWHGFCKRLGISFVKVIDEKTGKNTLVDLTK
jgi:hypothetical protein